jgi:biopolymer transport protein ExbB
MGLAVAVPGIILGRILERKERRFRDELEQIKDLLCGESKRPAEAAASA